MRTGAFILIGMCLIALFAPYFDLPNPYQMSLKDQFSAPSLEHPFGLDQNGASVLSRVIYGARISLLVAFSVVGLSCLVGLIVGSITGYFGGWIDNLTMRFIDMLYAFPGFLLAIALVAVLGPSINNLIIAMCITGWTGYARLVRGEFLYLRTKEYVVAADALGASAFRKIIKHIWPNLAGPLLVQASFGMAGTIITESSLSFLGLGAPPTTPTWGGLLNAGRAHLIQAPHISIFPGLAIVLLVLGFNLFADGLRDWYDPKKTSNKM